MLNHNKHDIPEIPDDFTVIGIYQTERAAHEAGLSVLASGHHYWVRLDDRRFLLIVRSAFADLLRREVEIADIRNRYWPPPSLDLPSRAISKWPTGAFILSLVMTFSLQERIPELSVLGMNSSTGVLQNGEWWRLFTAMTLHSDIGHIASNILGISLFAYLCCRYMGNGLAWMLIVCGAALSNMTNVFLKAGESYHSLGASTAVFAALGLLAGFPIGSYLRSREPIQNRDWMIPFFGGCVLFAIMGGGDFPTDVSAHLWAFGYGTTLATIVAFTAVHAKIGKLAQRGLVGLAFGALGLAWLWALLA